MKELSYLARSPRHYNGLNIIDGPPEQWEDGMRTHGGKGSYEWWYFDAQLEDESKIVIVFYTKAMTDVNKPINAYATLNIDYKDGTKAERYLPSVSFSASKLQCDVHIGNNYFKGDLNTYHIHLEDYDFKLDVEFKSESESWRPGTGHFYFGDKGHYFAWFIAVPKGYAKINYHLTDKVVNTVGTCYHDHNWGNKGIYKLINHWYWSRSELGPYTIVACEIIPEKKFGNEPIKIIYISKDGKKIADNADHLQLYKSEPIIGLGEKPINNDLIFNYKTGENRFELHLIRRKNIMETYLIPQEFKRKLVKLLTGFNGAYFRITGEARFDVFLNEQLDDSFKNDNSIWELMYFGNPN